MFGNKMKKENEELQNALARITQEVADLKEANRVLTSAVERNRSELAEKESRIAEAEGKAGRLLMELERERVLNGELQAKLKDADDFEREAAEINERLNRIARERSNYLARISHLERTVAELRQKSGEPESARISLQFGDIEDEPEIRTDSPKKRRSYGEPFRPPDPSKGSDRNWLCDLPSF